MDCNIQKDEKLYRAVKRSKPSWISADGKPTSAMFKDDEGVSVDRDGKRPLDEIIEFMRKGTFKGRLRGVAELTVEKCMELTIRVDIQAAPSKDNPYHANIYLDKDEMKSSLQALMLADVSELVYNDVQMQWVNICYK